MSNNKSSAVVVFCFVVSVILAVLCSGGSRGTAHAATSPGGRGGLYAILYSPVYLPFVAFSSPLPAPRLDHHVCLPHISKSLPSPIQHESRPSPGDRAQ